MSGRKGPVKPVFNSPGQIEIDSFSSTPASTSTEDSIGNKSTVDKLVERHGLQDDVGRAINEHRREEHLKRLKNLRTSLLDYLDSTAWQYPPPK